MRVAGSVQTNHPLGMNESLHRPISFHRGVRRTGAAFFDPHLSATVVGRYLLVEDSKIANVALINENATLLVAHSNLDEVSVFEFFDEQLTLPSR